MNPIQDSMIRIKNSYNSKRLHVEIQKSQKLLRLMEILRKYGYIKGFQTRERTIKVLLKYSQDYPVIKQIKLYSPLDVNTVVSYKQLKSILKSKESFAGLSLTLVSTSFGILTDLECLERKIGGHLILTVL